MDSRLGVYRRLFGYIRPFRREFMLAYVAMLAATLLNLIVPQVIKSAIDNGVEGGQPAGLFIAGGVILAIAIVRSLAGFSQRYYGNWLTHRLAYELRDHFFLSIQGQSFAFHDQVQTGDLMSRATSDITETERFGGIGMLDLSATLLLLVGVMVAMFLESSYLFFFVILPLLLLLTLALRFGQTIRPMFKRIQRQMGVLSTTMQESMTGIGVIKAFAKEKDELRKFDRENDDWFQRRYAAISVWANYWPAFTFILAVSVLLLLWFGGPLVLRDEISVGSLFAMISYVLLLNGPVLRLGFLVNMAATASASATRIFEIIDAPNRIVEPTNAIKLRNAQGRVRFEEVHFAYREGSRDALKAISFEVKPGQVIALIGPTGSGKSTIINLIPRFYDPTEGRVLIDGHDVRTLNLQSLRRNIGIVLQEPFLFDATIAENIAYGCPDSAHSLIEEAARAARAHDFIQGFPQGYQTQVGERGVTLSGGQKQRIAIARALICDPCILVLDDSTSSVDTETEHLIQQALAHLMKGRTTFVIAQRLLTLKNADAIYVLEQGRIIERGHHADLLALNGLYRQIYDLQLKDQEELMKSGGVL